MRNKIIMLSKKEYKENLIRMWDSLRDEAYKGATMCEGVTCRDCPLYNKACGSFYVFEALELVEKWAKEHQIKTNADKFKEMFGVDAPMNRCIQNDVFCADCEYYELGSEPTGCKANERFWNAEYKEPKKEGAEDD